MEKNKRNTRGITLIALVITIIVLLILAGVTITVLSGENGILTLMDVWLRWLTSKFGISNQIYCLGTFYMRMPLCIKCIPNYNNNR